jgi:hydroxypyruvate isomerase
MVASGPHPAWHLRYAPHLGFPTREEPYFRHSVGSNDPVAQIRYIAELGFAGVADKDLKLRPVEEQTRIGEELARCGLEMGVFVDQPEKPRSPWGSRDPADIAFLRERLLGSIEVARRVGGRHIGISAIRDPRIPLSFQHAAMVENLRWAVEAAEKARVIICIEALSEARVPGMLLPHIADACLLVTAVASDLVRLVFDTVHVQIQGGDLINNFLRTRHTVQLLQIADNPGRNEPGTGEIHFVNFLRSVEQAGFSGLIELEHFHAKPGREGEQAALAALRAIDSQL